MIASSGVMSPRPDYPLEFKQGVTRMEQGLHKDVQQFLGPTGAQQHLVPQYVARAGAGWFAVEHVDSSIDQRGLIAT